MAGFLFSVAALFFISGMLLAAVIFGWQCLQWLKYGAWQPLVVNDGLLFIGLGGGPRHPLEWVGLQKLLDAFLFQCPLTVGVAGAAIIISWGLNAAAREEEETAKKRRAEWQRWRSGDTRRHD